VFRCSGVQADKDGLVLTAVRHPMTARPILNTRTPEHPNTWRNSVADRIVVTPVALCMVENAVVNSLRQQGFEVVLHPSTTPPTVDELREYLRGAVGMIAGMEPIPAAVIEGADRLRVISRFGVGYDNIDCAAATRQEILVTYIPEAMTETVADLTLGLMLALARRIPELDAAMKEEEWRRVIGADVTGRTLGLLGTGRIGMAVARRAAGFRMRLLGYDPIPSPSFVEMEGEYVSFEDLLRQADFISLHLPLLPETRGAIGAPQLALVKPSAFLINCARGALVDEAAVYAALTEGRLAGFGTDVYPKEPPDPQPLYKLPNVVALPHIASYTPDTAARMGQTGLANLLAGLNGERPEFVVNPEVAGRKRE
jgi:D-3-phosphoglycerate dehydrogenase / 2-oxoglutarate reductase